MRTLDDARAVCETHLPGLYAALDEVPLLELERRGNPGLELFRKHGGPALVIPKAYSGLGATPTEAVRVMRAIGSRAPSLSVATAMHHFSVATLFTLADSLRSQGTEWAILEGIAAQNLLVASGFAEGRPGQGILSPAVRAQRAERGYLVNGAKKPCSMAHSMDMLSASAAVPTEDGGVEMILLLIPGKSQGISTHPFWASDVLAGAESDEVRLADVFVDERLATRAEVDDQGVVDELQTVGFMWFELLISSCYLGMASGLVERAFTAGRSSGQTLAELGVRLETAAVLLESVARLLEAGVSDNNALATTLIARYAVQDAVNDAAAKAVEALGGVAFISAPEVAYLSSATRCLAFHPPSRSSSSEALARSLAGDVLRLN
ncbi:acyl-CoA dehydrogenase [Nocardia sp. NPDC052566]|uniref:acyl-CoA dehydrogenase n=1 Tax=Nocardia sp. NPDC052566 TaxID=3364330 RepID=UPI0037C717AC